MLQFFRKIIGDNVKYIDIQDTNKIKSGIEELNKRLMGFSKPEDLKPLMKMIKSNVPWYRRKDFYSFMTYVVLANLTLNNTRSQNNSNIKPQQGAKQVSESTGSRGYVMWTNYSPRNPQNANEYKKFIVDKASIDPAMILNIAPKRFVSFVTFKDEISLKKAINAINNQTFENRVIKANINNGNQEKKN